MQERRIVYQSWTYKRRVRAEKANQGHFPKRANHKAKEMFSVQVDG